jgi:hypothetical protein
LAFRGEKPDSAHRELKRSLANAKSTGSLALVHITPVGAAREIVESGQLEARTCRAFGKNLLYFFLLRPAYRFRDGTEKSDQISRFPCVFVASPAGLGDPFHVYPFDTGGAIFGVFGERPDPWVYLEDYELEPSLDSAMAHLEWAFDGRENYFDGTLRHGLMETLRPWDSVARSFVTIAGLASSTHNLPDRRASSIEVCYRQNVPLAKNINFAILPKQYLEDGSYSNTHFIEKLRAAGVDWDVYDWQPNKSPEDFRDEISRLVRSYLKGKGSL